MSDKLEIQCPCCEARLHVDRKTGEVLWKEEKKKPVASLSDMVKDLDKQREEAESLFKKRNEIHKDRSRLLDEKFKEARKHVDKDSSKPLRDFDLD